MGKKIDYCLFWGHQPFGYGRITQSCFSQWWMADFWSVANTYCCMEQYMMAAKAELFRDQESWGIGLSSSSSEANNPLKWRGQNLLGFALMEVRDELRRVYQNELLCEWNAV